MEKNNLFIGVMSGTSLDGIDIALCSIDKDNMQTLATKEYEYNEEIRKDVLHAISNPVTLQFIGTLNHKLGLMYSEAIEQFLKDFNINSSDVTAIGLHGQTAWHDPNSSTAFSMQLGDGALVAKKVGIDVINDFRSADIACGGQGAPLTPAFHQALFDDKQSAVLNLGGIANITILTDKFIGYDVGVANILSDYWINKNQGKTYDKEGQWASLGNVNDELLHSLLSDPYFNLAQPKSTGREYFNASWLEEKLQSFTNVTPVDVQATLIEFVIEPIVQALQDKAVKRLILCGGGAKNSFLMQRLSRKLDSVKVLKSDECGINSDFLEAIAFAWLAYKRSNHQTIDLRSITGADKPAILGAIHAKG